MTLHWLRTDREVELETQLRERETLDLASYLTGMADGILAVSEAQQREHPLALTLRSDDEGLD